MADPMTQIIEAQSSLISPQEELALAKLLPEGAQLSPAAQAIYEAEGRARFLAFHRGINHG